MPGIMFIEQTAENRLKGGMVKKLFVLSLALGAWLLCAATVVRSVRSSDTSKTSNTVSIELSDPAQYSVEKLPAGKGLRLTIRNVNSLDENPQYPRLSEVIDVVSARIEGGSAIIDIKTMGDFDVSHRASSDRSRITVSINSAPVISEAPQTVTIPAPTTQILNPPEAMPKKIDRPLPPSVPPARRETPPLPTDPPMTEKPAATEDIRLAPIAEDTVIPVKEAPGSGIPAAKAGVEETLSLDTNNWLIYVIIAAALLLILWVILKFLLQKGPRDESEYVAEPEAPAEGTTLLLDPETRRRMVQKLLDQGWSSSEIAREMRLGVKEVEEIVSKLKGGK